MSYQKSELHNLQRLLLKLHAEIDVVIDEGNATEDWYTANWEDHQYRSNWNYTGGTKATGQMRRTSLDLTRALAELRKP